MRRKNKERWQIALAAVLALLVFLFILDDSSFYTIPKNNLKEDSVEFLLKYVPEDESDTKFLMSKKTNSSYLLLFETGESYTAVTYNKSLILPLYARDSVYYNIEDLNGYKIHQDNHRKSISYEIMEKDDNVDVNIKEESSKKLMYNGIYALVCFIIIIFGVYFSVKSKIKSQEDDQ